MLRRSPFLDALPLPFLDDGEGGGSGGGTQETDPKPAEVTFDAKQQEKVNALLAEERRKTKETVTNDLKRQADQAKTAAEQKREQEEAEKRGEFDTVKKGLEGERDKATQERDGYKADLDVLSTHFETEFEGRVKALPENVWKYHKPADDASLATRIAALANAEAQAKDLGLGDGKPKVLPGNLPNPKPRERETDKDADEQARRATRPRM
ncbi:MAG: hypothetical protein WBA46_04580 [Thermomicrobiales bacterium]